MNGIEILHVGAPPCRAAKLPTNDYVIFGGTGDLALRKIFSAFFLRYLDGQLTDDFRLFATSRRAFNIEKFATVLRPFCKYAFAHGHATEERWQTLHPCDLGYVILPVDRAET